MYMPYVHSVHAVTEEVHSKKATYIIHKNQRWQYMIWYDMTILMCAQKLTDVSLIYRTGPKTKTIKKTKKLKNKRICSEETVPGKKPWS